VSNNAKMKILDFKQTYSTDNYPYGRLKATATFGVEFRANKGCRTSFQIQPIHISLFLRKRRMNIMSLCTLMLMAEEVW